MFLCSQTILSIRQPILPNSSVHLTNRLLCLEELEQEEKEQQEEQAQNEQVQEENGLEEEPKE